jgi:competence protein ComEC
MVSGGLWLMLWRARWRLLGLVPIAAGILVAPLHPRPDVLVGRNGELVAVRAPDGRLTALPARGASFDLARWLEHDGDLRTAAEAAKGAHWRCDAIGCTARVLGRTVAVSLSPAALRDDCRDAQVLVLRFTRAAPCAGPRVVVDRQALRSQGAHAIFLEPLAGVAAEEGHDGTATGLRVETVADLRGSRPWSMPQGGPGGRTLESAAPRRGEAEAIADQEP